MCMCVCEKVSVCVYIYIILCSLEPRHAVLIDRLLEQVQSEVVAQHCQITHLEVEERSHEIATSAPPPPPLSLSRLVRGDL